MAFTTEAIEAPKLVQQGLPEQNQFELPSREFIGYDPKGTTSITGSPLVKAAPQAPVAEESVPAEAPIPEVPEESVTLTPKISAIARKEQALRKQSQDLAKQKAELADKLAKADKYEQLTAKIKAKDYSATDELGLQYDEYVKHELNKESSKDPAEMRARKLEEEIASIKKAQEERDVAEYKRNQVLWKDSLTATFKDADKYPESNYAKSKGADVEQLALQLINDSFDEDGVEYDESQAAELVEKYFEDRAKFFEGSPSLNKNKSAPEAKVLGPPKASSKTITQTMTTTPKTAPTSKPFHLMSESEQLQEAIRRVQAAKLTR